MCVLVAAFATRGLFVKRRNMVDAGTTRQRIATGKNMFERQNRRMEISFTT